MRRGGGGGGGHLGAGLSGGGLSLPLAGAESVDGGLFEVPDGEEAVPREDSRVSVVREIIGERAAAGTNVT